MKHEAPKPPVVEFDHHAPEFVTGLWDTYAELRSRCPVARSTAHGGFWVVTGYDEVRQVALDDKIFSSAQSILIPPKERMPEMRSVPIEMDPPEFLIYRKILNPMFSPAAVEKVVPAIERYSNAAIDTFIEAGECDVIHDFADPVPAMVTLHMLGLPVEDWQIYSRCLHEATFLRPDNPRALAAREQTVQLRPRIELTIEKRKGEPRDDIISKLLAARVDGKPVDPTILVQMILLILQGGLDTTGSQISNALLYLDGNPEARKELQSDPSRIRQAGEEFLRFEAPQQALARQATRDCVVGGQHIREGDWLLMCWASANRDARMFDAPDDVVLDRFPNRHVAFGLGAHRCLGSNLARSQFQIALREFLRRVPDYRVVHERVERAETVGIVYGLFALPVVFTPGSI